MASTKKTAREEKRTRIARIVALIIAAALLLSTFLVYLAGLR